jgi:hypothetical protein
VTVWDDRTGLLFHTRVQRRRGGQPARWLRILPRGSAGGRGNSAGKIVCLSDRLSPRAFFGNVWSGVYRIVVGRGGQPRAQPYNSTSCPEDTAAKRALPSSNSDCGCRSQSDHPRLIGPDHTRNLEGGRWSAASLTDSPTASLGTQAPPRTPARARATRTATRSLDTRTRPNDTRPRTRAASNHTVRPRLHLCRRAANRAPHLRVVQQRRAVPRRQPVDFGTALRTRRSCGPVRPGDSSCQHISPRCKPAGPKLAL